MWHSFKQIIKSTSGLNDVVLHVILGAAIFLALLVVLRRPILAFTLTAAIQIANEVVDLFEDATGTGVAGSVADIIWTLIVPAGLLAAARVRALLRV